MADYICRLFCSSSQGIFCSQPHFSAGRPNLSFIFLPSGCQRLRPAQPSPRSLGFCSCWGSCTLPRGVEPPHKGFEGSAWFRWKAKPWWKGCATRITSLHHPFAKHPSPVSWVHRDCLALCSFGLAQATGAKLCASCPQHPPNPCCVILVLAHHCGVPSEQLGSCRAAVKTSKGAKCG